MGKTPFGSRNRRSTPAKKKRRVANRVTNFQKAQAEPKDEGQGKAKLEAAVAALEVRFENRLGGQQLQRGESEFREYTQFIKGNRALLEDYPGAIHPKGCLTPIGLAFYIFEAAEVIINGKDRTACHTLDSRMRWLMR